MIAVSKHLSQTGLAAVVVAVAVAVATRAPASSFVIRSSHPACPLPGAPPEEFNGCPPYTDANILAAVPKISSDDQRGQYDSCGPWSAPTDACITYLPRVVSKHRVILKSLRCSCYCDRLECSYDQSDEVFDSDPREHFKLGEGVDAETGIAIDRMYKAGRITGTEKYASWSAASEFGTDLVAIVREGQAYRATFESYACKLSILVKVESTGASSVLRLMEEPDGSCI
ncbi:MAG TPA: hypothetical protein VEC57_07390 [Candidatus Limnocylindrales bacterium]|nr:hypothetical protein [Candidatus Limnocylindrales bacterium]